MRHVQMEGGWGKKRVRWKEITFCTCKWEWESKNIGICADHLGPVNRLSLSLSPPSLHCLCLCTCACLPAATVQEVDSKRRQEWGASSREAGETAKVSISKQSWHRKVPFPLHQICLSNYHWVALSLQTLSNSWSRCMRMHAPGPQNWRMCPGMGTSI